MNTSRVRTCLAIVVVACGLGATPATADQHPVEDALSGADDALAVQVAGPVPVTVQVIVEGLQYRKNSHINVELIRSVDGNRFTPRRRAVVACDDESSETCLSAKPMTFEFKEVDAGVAHVLMLCQTRRTAGGCPRSINGKTVEVGHIMDVVPTPDDARYTISLEDRY
ncbi:MAG: hypothetical protein AB8G17_16840 [Gammaproteobacteria bacterium]